MQVNQQLGLAGPHRYMGRLRAQMEKDMSALHVSALAVKGKPGRVLARAAPVSFVQDDHLVPSRRQRGLLLCKHLYFVAYYVDAPARQLVYLSQAAGTITAGRSVCFIHTVVIVNHKRATHRSSDAFSSRTASL